jgi:hypothetical protein
LPVFQELGRWSVDGTPADWCNTTLSGVVLHGVMIYHPKKAKLLIFLFLTTWSLLFTGLPDQVDPFDCLMRFSRSKMIHQGDQRVKKLVGYAVIDTDGVPLKIQFGPDFMELIMGV